MQLSKLNDDSSWMFHFDELRVIVDPWFSASQVDFHPLFSRQFHKGPQPNIETIQQPNYIFISHPFTDHCNKETLLQFDKNIPLIALPSILTKITKWNHFRKLMTLEEAPFAIQVLQTKNALVHKAYLIESVQEKIVYAPHGAVLKKNVDLQVDAVISTTLQYQLPFYLGGTINLGFSRALQLKEQLSAKVLIDTHSEDKIGQGLVSFFSKRKFSLEPGVVYLKIGEIFDLEPN
ncbi:MAG: hypothetical protein FJ349_00200 [Sphingomonadales bacterium]|nr:hypothetical protein [Sphingomonadales bacterium]